LAPGGSVSIVTLLVLVVWVLPWPGPPAAAVPVALATRHAARTCGRLIGRDHNPRHPTPPSSILGAAGGRVTRRTLVANGASFHYTGAMERSVKGLLGGGLRPNDPRRFLI